MPIKFRSVGIGICFALFLGVSFLSFINFTSSIDKNQLALQSQRAMYEIDRLSAQLYAAQEKVRGFLLAGDKSFRDG